MMAALSPKARAAAAQLSDRPLFVASEWRERETATEAQARCWARAQAARAETSVALQPWQQPKARFVRIPAALPAEPKASAIDCKRRARGRDKQLRNACSEPTANAIASQSNLDLVANRDQCTRMPGFAPLSGESTNDESPSPAAKIIPSLVPNFICRGFKLAHTMTSRPISDFGS